MLVYKCPRCGWITSAQQYHRYRYDFGCPRCGTSFKDFFPMRMFEQKEYETLKTDIAKRNVGEDDRPGGGE
jgi:uncharacterized C2H2 Zn-finger protein